MDLNGKSKEELISELSALQQKYENVVALYDEKLRESRETEQSLIENQANIKAIIENSLDSVWSINRGYYIQYVNENFARSFFATFGVELKPGVNILDSLPAGLRDIWKERYDRAFNNEHFVFTDKIDLGHSALFIEVAMNPIVINGQVVGASFYGKDITDRKNSEVALKESEERFKALHNASFGGILIHDQGIVVDCNQGLALITGYTVDELIGMDGLQLIAPEFRSLVKTHIAEQYEKPYEAVGVRKNGERFPLRLEGKAIPYKGKIMRTAEFRDITEQKRAEQAVWESQTNFKALFEKGPIGVAYHRMIYDKKGNPCDYLFLDANQSYQHITGINPIGKLVTEAFPGIEKDPFDWIGKFGEVAKTGREIRFQQNFSLNNAWYDIVAYQYKPDHFVAAFLDITERMHAEKALKESEEIFSRFMENSPYYVFFKDHNIRALRLSKNFEELIGKPMNDILGKNMYEIFPTEFARKMVDDDIRILKSRKIETIEEEFNGRFYSTIKFPIIIDNIPRYLAGFTIDITEQKLAGNALRNSEERLKILFNYAPEAYYLSDLKGNFVDGNIVAEKLLGYKRDEMIGKNFFKLKLLSAKQLLKAAKLLALNVLGNPTGPDEFTLQTKNNQKVTVEITTHPVKISGQILVLGMARDISERKKAEKAMKVASENWNRTFQTMHSGIALLDSQLHVIQANRSFEILTGIDEAHLKGKRCVDLLYDVPLPDGETPFEKLKLTKVCESSEVNLNGRICELMVDPICDTENIITGAVTIITDVTQRKRDENIQHILHEFTGMPMFDKSLNELLIVVRQALSKVIDTTNFFVALHNPETDTLRKVIFEDEKDDFVEWDANKSLSGKVLKLATTLLLDSAAESRFAAENNIELLGSPAECWLGVPLMSQDRAIGVMVVQSYTDKNAYDFSAVRLLSLIAHELSIVIERKRMIQDLVAAKEKAVESDRLKSAFLANMSHEIRTPMNGILGFAELLKQPRLTDDEQQLFISMIEKSGERLLNIINDLISISKIESGQMDIWYSEPNINEQIDFLFNFFGVEAKQKGIQLIKSCALPNSDAVIKTDREKLYAILTNLIKNAIKFTNKGYIEFGYQTTNEYLLFYVKDSGIGVAASKQKSIFERFVRATTDLHGEYEGAGLGLSISKAYVEMLKGKIWMESEEGKGTCFYFTLPFELSTTNVGTEAIKNTDSIQVNVNVSEGVLLIAEDDEISAKYLMHILKSCNTRLLFARTGAEAIEKCIEVPEIELVLMDINMPGMNGFDAAGKIKALRPELPILAQTAFALNEDKEKYGGNFDGYVTKPIKADALKAIIGAYIKNFTM